jgi:ribosomal protein L11
MLKKMRMKVIWTLALALGVLALTAGAAFADGTAPATGTTGATGATVTNRFNCDAAKTRLANVEARITAIQARISSGHVKNPAAAAARLAAAQDRAGKITTRIARRHC